ncbi:hypothetical protein Desor_0631 [Desulfosporosinus orientis DSM 765]|uniref:Uncharacterized protein n=1 Tax=Desulfosporosinus orientis (strain ATCC 19365 / DSM 765 / NCIMB 8382 / VKM B-1628 / Singapore I) TaxID=768706 RepID=G7W597_DESOD|nr:hypothetical protein [Desulfosporosinus orientis]AET66325.1 hypothetical protein Desor_0631 [Desulfosporosinus orientis DSM 765]
MSSESKPSVLKTIVFLALAISAYLLIFFNIEQLNKFYVSQGVIPAVSLLGTVICIAFLYGTAVSHILSILGLESKH